MYACAAAYGQATALQGSLKATVLIQEKAFDRGHCPTLGPAMKKMLDVKETDICESGCMCTCVCTHGVSSFP